MITERTANILMLFMQYFFPSPTALSDGNWWFSLEVSLQTLPSVKMLKNSKSFLLRSQRQKEEKIKVFKKGKYLPTCQSSTTQKILKVAK